MAQLVPISPGLLPGQPLWINLDQVNYVTADDTTVMFWLTGDDYIRVDCGDQAGVIRVLELLDGAR